MAQKTGLGCTLAFASPLNTYSPKYLSIVGPSLSREALDSSHLGTTTIRTFVPDDLYDGGEIKCDLFWDALDGMAPIGAVAVQITITNNDSGAAIEVFSGFITSFEASRSLGSLQSASMVIKVAGAITFTA